MGLALSLAVAVAAWAGYTGPNRTTTESVRDPDEDQWFCKRTGFSTCYFAVNPGNPCPDYGGTQPSVTFQQNVCGWVGDTCGCNEAYTESTTTLPPAVVAGSASCGQPGSGGWCRGEAKLDLSANEPLSGEVIQFIEGDPGGVLCDPADSSSVACTWSGGVEGAFSIDYWAVSSYGDTSTLESAAWSIDSTPPSVSLNISGGTPGGGGWYRAGTVTVSASGADALSGLARAEVSRAGGSWTIEISIKSDGVHSVTGRALDVAGNEATHSEQVRYDGTPPNLGSAIKGSLGWDGWYTSHVTISGEASDALSGVDLIQVDLGEGWVGGPLTLARDGQHQLRVRAVDVAGNEAVGNATSIKIDATLPESVFIDPPNATEVWVSGLVPLLGRSLDLTSGLHAVEISFDEGLTWIPLQTDQGSWSSSWDTSDLPNGRYRVMARAQDRAGNLESTAWVVLLVDNVPPFVDIPDSWLVSESGELVVEEGDAGLDSVQVIIGQGGDTTSYAPDNLPDSIRWDGLLNGGEIAPAGSYPVRVMAWDLVGNQGEDTGVIIVPAPAAEEEPEGRAPLAVGLSGRASPGIDTKRASVGFLQQRAWLWPAIAWIGLVAGIGVAKIADPRPEALGRLREDLELVRRMREE